MFIYYMIINLYYIKCYIKKNFFCTFDLYFNYKILNFYIFHQLLIYKTLRVDYVLHIIKFIRRQRKYFPMNIS